MLEFEPKIFYPFKHFFFANEDTSGKFPLKIKHYKKENGYISSLEGDYTVYLERKNIFEIFVMNMYEVNFFDLIDFLEYYYEECLDKNMYLKGLKNNLKIKLHYRILSQASNFVIDDSLSVMSERMEIEDEALEWAESKLTGTSNKEILIRISPDEREKLKKQMNSQLKLQLKDISILIELLRKGNCLPSRDFITNDKQGVVWEHLTGFSFNTISDGLYKIDGLIDEDHEQNYKRLDKIEAKLDSMKLEIQMWKNNRIKKI